MIEQFCRVHYIIILIFFYFHVWIRINVKMIQKKDIPLENMANQCIRYLDAKSKHMTMKCLEGEKQYSCPLKTNEE